MKNFLQIFYTNIPIKLLSLVVAIGVWLYAVNAGVQIDHLTTQVPIDVYNLQDGLALSQEIGSIDLQVRAPEAIFGSLTADDFVAFVDLANLTEGTHDVQVSVLTNTPSVQILAKTPDHVNVKIEKQTQETFTVNVETTGSLGEGFIASDPKVEPGEVKVSGGKSALAKIQKVIAPVALNGEQVEVSQVATLKALDEKGNVVTNVTMNPSTARVTIPVERQNDTKTVGIRTNITGKPASGFAVDTIDTSRSSVTIRGKSSTIKDIEFLETDPISISGITSSTTKQVSLVVPGDIEVLEGKDIDVTINVKRITASTTFSTEVLFTGLPSSLRLASHTPQNIDVTLEGASSIVNNLSAGDISVELSLTDQTEGTHTLTVRETNINVPDGVSIANFQPRTITVVIEKK